MNTTIPHTLTPASVLNLLHTYTGDLDDLLRALQTTPEDLSEALQDQGLHDQLKLRINLALLQARLLAATYLPLAMRKLPHLLEADKPEVVRRTTMTILGMNGIATKTETQKPAAPPQPNPLDDDTLADSEQFEDRALENAETLFDDHNIDLQKLLDQHPAHFVEALKTYIDTHHDQSKDPDPYENVPEDRALDTAMELEEHEIHLGKLSPDELPALVKFIESYTPAPETQTSQPSPPEERKSPASPPLNGQSELGNGQSPTNQTPIKSSKTTPPPHQSAIPKPPAPSTPLSKNSLRNPNNLPTLPAP